MKPNLKLIMAVSWALIGLIALNVWQASRVQALGRERDQARQEMLLAQAHTQALQQRFNAYAANADHIAADLRAALAQQATTNAQLQKVYQDDDQAKEWANRPVPAGISRLLQPASPVD